MVKYPTIIKKKKFHKAVLNVEVVSDISSQDKLKLPFNFYNITWQYHSINTDMHSLIMHDIYLFYTLIKLYYTKALSDQASSLAPD